MKYSNNNKKVDNKKVPKLLIPKEVTTQILFMNSKINVNEWSGVLFYKAEGNKIEELELTAEYILPMDKGTSAYTEFTSWENLIEFFEEKPEFEQAEMGLIHSHNNMSVFFSGTDSTELKDNSANYNYYLSVIVNNKLEVTAKIGVTIEAKVKREGEIIINGEIQKIVEEKVEKIFKEYDVDVELELPVDETFLKYFEKAGRHYEVKGKHGAKNKNYYNKNSYGTYGSNFNVNSNSIYQTENIQNYTVDYDEKVAKEVAARVTGYSPGLAEKFLWDKLKTELNKTVYNDKTYEEFGQKVYRAALLTAANNRTNDIDVLFDFFEWAKEKAAHDYFLKQKIEKLEEYV